MFDALADREVTNRLALAIGWDDALARLRAGPAAVARGDFGEVLSAALLEEYEGFCVPVRKLRFKVDASQTQHGTDAVAFDIVDDEIIRVEFIESKLRTRVDTGAGVQAHDQLLADREAGFADIIGFVAEQLAKDDPPMYELFLRYLESRERREERGSYGIALVTEMDTWRERTLDRIDELDPLLESLTVRFAKLANLVDLIDQTYALVGLVAADDGS
jgi:hypothetical protein